MQYKFGVSIEIKQLNKLNKFKKKAIGVTSFKPKNEPINSLFRNLKILTYDNCIFVHDQLNENLPESFSNILTMAPVQHNYYKINNKFDNQRTELCET